MRNALFLFWKYSSEGVEGLESEVEGLLKAWPTYISKVQNLDFQVLISFIQTVSWCLHEFGCLFYLNQYVDDVTPVIGYFSLQQGYGVEYWQGEFSWEMKDFYSFLLGYFLWEYLDHNPSKKRKWWNCCKPGDIYEFLLLEKVEWGMAFTLLSMVYPKLLASK